MARSKLKKIKRPQTLPTNKQSNNQSQPTLDKVVNNFALLYQNGKMKEALAVLEQGLVTFPNEPTLLSNAGVIATMLGNSSTAEKYFKTSLTLNPNNTESHNNLANLLLQQKRFGEAQHHYRLVIKLNPKHPDVYNNLASLLKKLKRFDEAEQAYQTALKLNPNDARVHSNLGILFKEQKRFKEAEQTYKTALKLNPNDAKAYNNLGVLFKEQKRFNEAEEFYQNALTIDQNYRGTHYNLGNLFAAQKRFEEAEQAYQTALKLNPNDAKAYNNLGVLFKEQKRFDEAEQSYQEALKLNPEYVEAYNNLGVLFAEQKRFDEAEQSYQETLKLNPEYVEAYNNLGVLFAEQKRFDRAEQSYQEALKLDPNHTETQLNLSLLLLRLGEFRQGWQNFESRYHADKKDRMAIPPKISTPQYLGQELTNKSLLIYLEQGFGDEIQCIRYLPLLKQDKGVKQIMLVCKPPLKSLFANLDCIDHLLDSNEFERIQNLKGLDYWVFIMSLPLHFNTTLETIPNQLPYLTSPKAARQRWQHKLPKDSFNIGLVWKGLTIHKNDANRSIPSLSVLKPLWSIDKNITFISLQKGAGEEQASNPPRDQPILHLGNQIQDFSDTAAIVSQLDLVISVDTAIVHLAGSLNIPCWVLLPDYNTDWRWLIGREDSPWYPNSMRLFRQTTNEDWAGVINKVVEALKQKDHDT